MSFKKYLILIIIIVVIKNIHKLLYRVWDNPNEKLMFIK